jgi:O-antigen/teichoic acid export membrane protein
LIMGRILSSGLGFLAWLITARLFEAHDVGIASGIVSAMMLCVQLALLGVGAAIIRLYPRYEDRPAPLVNTGLWMVSASSLLIAILFLLLSSLLFHRLDIVSASLPYSMLFLAITVFGTVNSMMDYVSIARKRGDHVLLRNVAFGITTILAVAALPLLAGKTQSIWIIFAWAAAGLLACTMGGWQMARSLRGYRFGLNINMSIGHDLVQIGLPNYILTLTDRAPNWILPILITEMLSPADNAHWYQIWMTAWVVFLVPISIGQNLFAEISHHPGSARKAIRRSLRTSLWLGCTAALMAAILAPTMLSLLGKDYVAAGATPLRILVLAVIPVTMLQIYYAVCRGTHRLNEASITGLINGLVSVSICVGAGMPFGITGMAVAWLVTQSLAGLWASLRILKLFKQLPDSV